MHTDGLEGGGQWGTCTGGISHKMERGSRNWSVFPWKARNFELFWWHGMGPFLLFYIDLPKQGVWEGVGTADRP